MRFFDIVNLKDADLQSLAKELGYSRILCAGRDVFLSGSLGKLEGAMNIVVSESGETLSKAARDGSVMGVVCGEAALSGKLVEELRENEKLVLIPVSGIVCAGRHERMRALYRAKSALRKALMGKAKVAIVTLAERKECMLSSMQMAEIAGLLGADERIAKETLSNIGDYL